MRLIKSFTIIAFVPHLLLANPFVFSVYDDLLAVPQYEIVFIENVITDPEASLLISQGSSPRPGTPKSSSELANSISSKKDVEDENSTSLPSNPLRETNELLYLHGLPYLCNIPIIAPSPRNETSERQARAAERQELARATERGLELLQGLEGSCLYFVSGWWSYSFCYNSEVTQFHHLALQPGKQDPPKRDPNTKQFVLGRATAMDDSLDQAKRKSNGAIDVHREKQTPKLELQYKGGTRYLVQKMESGTICDLTGKPRRVEVQFHCSPSLTDRIGYIKEVTTCSYLMVVYTPRLCSDAVFLPLKENKVHTISCRMIVPEDDSMFDAELKAEETSSEANIQSNSNLQGGKEKQTLKTIGGITLGGRKWIDSESQRMSIPEIFGEEALDQKEKAVEIIARAKSKAEGGQIEVATNLDLKKLNLDPDVLESLLVEVQKMAKEKGWKIEIVDTPGQSREILGIVDGEDEEIGDKVEKKEESSEDEL